jgi:hypothetical protein
MLKFASKDLWKGSKTSVSVQLDAVLLVRDCVSYKENVAEFLDVMVKTVEESNFGTIHIFYVA